MSTEKPQDTLESIELNNTNTTPAKAKKSWLWSSVKLLTGLAVIAGLSFAGYQGNMQWKAWQAAQVNEKQAYSQKLNQLTQQVAQLQQQNKTLSDSITPMNEQLAQLSDLPSRLEYQDARIAELGSMDRTDWQLAEAEYLLKVASERLQLTSNASMALELVNSADAILLSLNIPDLVPVRRQIASDRDVLSAMTSVDETGLYLKLDSLKHEVGKLVLKQDFSAPKLKSTPAKADLNWLDKLAGLIEVKKLDAPINAVLPPEQQAYIAQNIRFDIAHAQLALLRTEPIIWQQSLHNAAELIETYFKSDNVGQVMVKSLLNLSKESINITPPNISASATALSNYLDRRHRAKGRSGGIK